MADHYKMHEFIRTMNRADMCAKLWKEGSTTALELEEQLISVGFCDVTFSGNTVRATLVAKQLELGNDG